VVSEVLLYFGRPFRSLKHLAETLPTSLKQMHINTWAYCSSTVSLGILYSHCALTSEGDDQN